MSGHSNKDCRQPTDAFTEPLLGHASLLSSSHVIAVFNHRELIPEPSDDRCASYKTRNLLMDAMTW
jgi:hypothetical protein